MIYPKSYQMSIIKVEYHYNENPLEKSEKIINVGQRLIYPIILKNNTLPHKFFFQMTLSF